jgi:hypothetical protein
MGRKCWILVQPLSSVRLVVQLFRRPQSPASSKISVLGCGLFSANLPFPNCFPPGSLHAALSLTSVEAQFSLSVIAVLTTATVDR